MAKVTYDVMNLPVSEISSRIEDWSLTIFSPPGLGKTTLIHSMFGDKVVFIRGERGTNAIRCRGIDVDGDWGNVVSFLSACQKAVKAGNTLPFNVVCFDTMDAISDAVIDYVIATEDDGEALFTAEKNNKGYAIARKAFSTVVTAFQAIGLYCIFLVHYTEKTIKRKLTDNYDEGQMSVSSTFQKICYDLIDLCGVIIQEKDDNGNFVRRLYFRHPDYGVKSRLSCMPDFIDLGNSAQEAGENFLKVFKKAAHDEAELEYNKTINGTTATSEKTTINKDIVPTFEEFEEVTPVKKVEKEEEKSDEDIVGLRKKVAKYYRDLESSGKITHEQIPILMKEAFGVSKTKELNDPEAILDFLAEKMTEEDDV